MRVVCCIHLKNRGGTGKKKRIITKERIEKRIGQINKGSKGNLRAIKERGRGICQNRRSPALGILKRLRSEKVKVNRLEEINS